jgi:hypothetical protein
VKFEGGLSISVLKNKQLYHIFKFLMSQHVIFSCRGSKLNKRCFSNAARMNFLFLSVGRWGKLPSLMNVEMATLFYDLGCFIINSILLFFYYDIVCLYLADATFDFRTPPFEERKTSENVSLFFGTHFSCEQDGQPNFNFDIY